MRELKFRAYDNINKEWLLGYKECGGFSMIGELMLMGEWQAILSKMLKGEFGEDGKQLFVQQYTGLKDKNGVEIYEGDIIINYISYSESLGGQIENSIGMVKWISREDKWDYSGWYAYPADLPWGDDDNNVEIIGNIFENNELLEK